MPSIPQYGKVAMIKGFKQLFIFCGAILIFTPLFVFGQEASIALKEKQSIDILDIIRKFPLSEAQSEFYYQSLYYPMSDYPEKTGAVMLVKQSILQKQLDYWFVKAPYELSKKFIKAIYKLLPLVAYGDFSGAIELIEKFTVEQANNYIDNWLKQNQVQIGAGIGNYAFASFKNNPQAINIPYIIVYSPNGTNKAKIVVEFYSQRTFEPPIGSGPNSLGGIQDNPNTTCWPWDIWLQGSGQESGLLQPFIVRVKGQVIKDQFGNFAWDKTASQPTVEVDFDKPVPEIDQSDIILKNLEQEETQGFLQDKINQIKQTAQGIIEQIKTFLAIFKPQAQISSFIEPPENGEALGFANLADLWVLLIQKAETGAEKESLLALIDQFDNISEQSEFLFSQAEQLINKQNDRVVYFEKAIEENQEDLASDQGTTSISLTIQPIACSQEFYQVQEPSFEKVIFNEIAWMGGKNSSADEWIELKNISVKPIDLNGWQIFNKSQGMKIVLATSSVVAPGGFWLLERTDDNSAPLVKADLIYTGAITNSDETLYLVSPNCILQDKAQAKPYWLEGDNSTKETMERTQFFGWQTSSVVGGTPKATNSAGKIKPSRGSGGSSASTGANGAGESAQQTNATSSATSTQEATSTNSGQATTTQQATSTIASTSSIAVLIVEIQTKDSSSTQNDFIKLFNQSTSSAADISDWQLKKKSSTGHEYSVKVFDKGAIIQPQGYFMWLNSDYATSVGFGVATSTQTISENNSVALFNAADGIADQVAWGSNTNPFVEGTEFNQNPQAGQNLIRKFSTTSQQYQDTNDNSQDFELGILEATSSQGNTATTSQSATTSQAVELAGIDNLMAIPSTVRGVVDLFWTCPTSASAYIIKKSDKEIVEQSSSSNQISWEQADIINQNISPKPAGEVEFLQVGGLDTNKKYFFAIKYVYVCQTCEGATSSISNSAFATTWQGFLDNGNGTLTDLRTNLMWPKDSQSAINNYGAVSTQPGAINFVSQKNSTSSTWFAGFSDWRVGNFKELASLFDYKIGSMAMNSNFQNIVSGKYWSKSQNLTYSPGFPGDEPRFDGWFFNFQNGEADSQNYAGNNSSQYSFLACRGAEIPGGMTNDNFNFTDNGDGTILDNRTGLMWLKAGLALADDSHRKTWQVAFSFASNAVLCNDGTLQGSESAMGDCSANGGMKYGNFRLPNVQEMLEITKMGPSLVLPWQQGGSSYFYWTGTMFDENSFWQVGDGTLLGKISTGNKNSQLNVQLVREP
ncbi:MAG: DUF1566 domain-containing protein [Candidatus Pacebacteria bacterium]|nr:DUF1566 domain-containing protein [Candidatus Paceibacterota bacterium]